MCASEIIKMTIWYTINSGRKNSAQFTAILVRLCLCLCPRLCISSTFLFINMRACVTISFLLSSHLWFYFLQLNWAFCCVVFVVAVEKKTIIPIDVHLLCVCACVMCIIWTIFCLFAYFVFVMKWCLEVRSESPKFFRLMMKNWLDNNWPTLVVRAHAKWWQCSYKNNLLPN